MICTQFFLNLAVLPAVWFDCRTYRVPNRYVIPLMGIGILYSVWTDGLIGLFASLAGIVIPIATLFLLFRLKMLGAGDIKLFAAIGSFIGLDIWRVMVLSVLIGGIYSMVRMLVSHSLKKRMQKFLGYILSVAHSGHMIPYNSGFEEKDYTNTVHFTIMIWVGYLLWMLKAGDWLL